MSRSSPAWYIGGGVAAGIALTFLLVVSLGWAPDPSDPPLSTMTQGVHYIEFNLMNARNTSVSFSPEYTAVSPEHFWSDSQTRQISISPSENVKILRPVLWRRDAELYIPTTESLGFRFLTQTRTNFSTHLAQVFVFETAVRIQLLTPGHCLVEYFDPSDSELHTRARPQLTLFDASEASVARLEFLDSGEDCPQGIVNLRYLGMYSVET